ncbi:interleukin 17 receptor A1a [Clinocottus analis]|uniref:interleukin 17 receptor A1a n=1 Tax=Clinocottus analis TaxID=304258 RepID=UPI0035C0E3E4
MTLLRPVVLALCVSLVSAVTVLPWPPLNCSRQGLRCTVTTSNCLDMKWLEGNRYTPSGPEGLQVGVATRPDEAGHLQPVLVANWSLRDDGSVRSLTATELQVLVLSTNQNLCVRYSFQEKLSMRRRTGEKWSFSADMLVLDPGQTYQVSVVNIPKPQPGHSSYHVSTAVTVPGCPDPTMQMTEFCMQRGSLWQPDIRLTRVAADSGRATLAVGFTTSPLCEEYMVIVSCSTSQHVERTTSEADHKTLNVTFSLDRWPTVCCQFDVEIKPFFPQCGQDCARRKGAALDICPALPTEAPEPPVSTFVVLGVVSMCVVTAVVMYVLCRKQGKPSVREATGPGDKVPPEQLKQPPKVLVIYSHDHRLYKDVVLKLCAFLQAKCGTQVLVDLLDSTSVSMVGRLRWLEWQRQQLKNPSDKILVLCSKGVQAKWRAMCGQGRVTLREDVLSPTDDMLTPFLNLSLPDMHQAGMLGKYLVAYFDDISREEDVPSVFDLAVKYKLMKHFEELYFRILDIEKYQPGQVNHIKGIGGDEYFDCSSGSALKNAIEAFQAYQVENPDWFEKECVNDEDDVMTETNRLIDQLQIPPVLECVPRIRDGLPVYFHQVEINETGDGLLVLTPELNPLSSMAELTPLVNPQRRLPYLSNLDEVLTNPVHPHSPSVYILEPVMNNLRPPGQTGLSPQAEPFGPTEDEKEDSLLPMGQISAYWEKRSSAPQDSCDAKRQECLRASMLTEDVHQSEMGHSQPAEMEEAEVLEPSGKGPSSGSDQGYISKMSSQVNEDPLVALRRLQEELFHKNLVYSDSGPEGN